jgi:FKBP-type peptidyl-prolyl cis-trans isomerase FkpA
MTKNCVPKITVTLISLLFLFSCNDSSDDLRKEKEMRLLRQYLELNNITVEPTASGLYYIPLSEGTGDKPGRNHWVIIRYTGKLINDKVFETTDEAVAISNKLHSTSVLYGNRRLSLESLSVQGVVEGLMMMREGGTATLILPSHLGFGSTATAVVPAYSTLVYEVELIRVINDPVEYEAEMIDDYLSMYADSTHLSDWVEVKVEESKFYYLELVEGSGEEMPEDSDEVRVFYHGTLTDGRVFDSNMRGSAFNFVIGARSTIPGFEEAIKQMKKEGRSRVLIPSELGYGVIGSGMKITGYTPLVFELNLFDIKKKE